MSSTATAAASTSADASSSSHTSAPHATTKRWALAIHGGAGAISREFDPERREYMRDLRLALDAGSAILRDGGSAMAACIAATRVLEDSPLFNAGLGSVLTANGRHELDAGVMRGSDMSVGACAGVRIFKNPILLAEKILDHSPHVLLIGDGAEAFGRQHSLEQCDNSYFTTPARLKVHQELMAAAAAMQAERLQTEVVASQAGAPTASPNPPITITPLLDHSFEQIAVEKAKREREAEASKAAAQAAIFTQAANAAAPIHGAAFTTVSSPAPAPGAGVPPSLGDKKFGTVGAVALDIHGELVSAVSTGGMSMKSYGRVGDSPIVGAGFYATSRVAVCCTGNGEAFLRSCVAKDVQALMDYKGLSLAEAADQAIANGERQCGKVDFEGGLIAVDSHGHIAMPYNSHGMYRGSVSSTHEAQVAVWRD